MRRRTLELGLEAASVCAAATVLAIVLDASIQVDDGIQLDFSRGRGVVLLLSLVLIGMGAFMFRRSWASGAVSPSSEVAQSDAVPALEASAEVIRGGPEDTDAPKVPMTEDESRLYQMISESGGEMLQMHIVSSQVFSKAKVTRLLDKLEKRGLVKRERHGMTNRIRIIR